MKRFLNSCLVGGQARFPKFCAFCFAQRSLHIRAKISFKVFYKIHFVDLLTREEKCYDAEQWSSFAES
jgi:hypothetical protein